MQNKVMARVLATMMASTTVVSTASVPMMVAPIVAMAADTSVTKEISVSKVEEGATVKAYQLVDGTYDESGNLTEYTLTALALSEKYDGTADVTLNDLRVYNSSDATTDNTDKLAAWTTAIAPHAASSSVKTYDLTTTGTGDECTYKVDAEPGLYLVLISKAASKNVYNPILLAVNIGNANQVSTSATGSTVDVTTFFSNGTGHAYAKKTTNGFDKEIVSADGSTEIGKATTANASPDGKTAGDTIYFRLDEMIIPSYSAQYTDPQYVITDILESGCYTGITGLTVKVGGATVEAGSTTYTLTDADGGTFSAGTSTSFKITFAASYLKDTTNANKAVEITYNSSLTQNATQNFAENSNHASLTYSYANGQSTTSTNTLYDNTYVYTFGIDKNIDSEDAGSGYIDYTLNKVTEAVGASNFEQTSDNGVTTKKSTKPLEGATFGLYSDESCTTQVSSMLSATTGHIPFAGLAAGTYYLKETTAPTGYTLSSTIYKIEITPTIDATGKMSQYTIKTSSSADSYAKVLGTTTISATAASTVEATGDIPYTITESQRSITPIEIVNTTLQQLPFTGGAGRYAIYIGSIALAALVVVLLVVRHRRNQEQ